MELVFMYSIPATGLGKSPSSICHPPLVLLRVCKMWREIALTTPQLWTSVEPEIPAHLLHSSESGPDIKKQQREASFSSNSTNGSDGQKPAPFRSMYADSHRRWANSMEAPSCKASPPSSQFIHTDGNLLILTYPSG
jgi:hypothetical protein